MKTIRGSNSATTVERAAAYLAKMPPSVSGQGGHTTAFATACKLIHGFNLSTAEALPLLLEWNARCLPPWSESDLRHKLADAEKVPSRNGRGYLLSAQRGAAGPVFVSPPPPPPPTARSQPDCSDFARGTQSQIQTLADARPFNREGLEWANERGLLVFGWFSGLECYGVTDSSGRLLEVRRLDGEMFPAIPRSSLHARKSHAVKGSQKAWPLGILEARNAVSIALLEGVPDLLSAHYVILWEQASHETKRDVRCAPVAMLSASPAIHAEALPHFGGKHVRIFPHAERAGLRGAVRWRTQLIEAGAAKVDVWDFSAYRRGCGLQVNDLWEFNHELHADHFFNQATWEIMP